MLLPNKLRVSGLLVLALLAKAAAADPLLVVVPDHADGVYALGERATWTVDVKEGDRSGLKAVPYSVKRDGLDEVAKGTLDLSFGPATFAASRGEPGAFLAVVSAPDGAKPLGYGGAVFAPEKLVPTFPAPADFDAFWQEKLKELAAVPPNPVVGKGSVEGVPNGEKVDYYKVSLDNVRGARVQGQLARPKAGSTFPAMVIFQWAGVYPLQKEWAVAHAKDGWLVLNIEAHDIPIDASPEFYRAQGEGPLKDYVFLGNENRDQSYFVRMFLGCVRAVDYLASRPDWDGKTIVVTGGSQGGLQSFAAAALSPKVSQLMVLCPAGCDNDGPLATPPRAFGWPYWLSGWGPPADREKVRRTDGYFDAIHFAARVKCPALVGLGLIDDTARPAGVFAAYNAIPEKGKELVATPFLDHSGSRPGMQEPYQRRFYAWRYAIQAGLPLPPPPN